MSNLRWQRWAEGRPRRELQYSRRENRDTSNECKVGEYMEIKGEVSGDTRGDSRVLNLEDTKK